MSTFKHTCSDSGVELECQHVSYTLVEEIMKTFKPPEAPLVETQVGDRIEMVRNEAHPDHVSAMTRYKQELNEKVNRLIVIRGVRIDVLTVEQKAKVDELRKQMLEEFNVTLNKDDKHVYIFSIAAVTPEDYQDLVNAISRRSHVTVEGKAEAISRFRTQK